MWPTKKPTIPYIYHIRFLCRHINKKVKNKAFDSKYLSKLSQVTSCAGAFRARSVQLWQLVLSKEGVAGGYARPFL